MRIEVGTRQSMKECAPMCTHAHRHTYEAHMVRCGRWNERVREFRMGGKVHRPRRFAAMRVIIIVWLCELVGDNKLLAMIAVAPCCAACTCGKFKESLQSVTVVSCDLQTPLRL